MYRIYLNLLVSFFSIALVTSSLNAQTPIKEGKLIMKVTDIKLADESKSQAAKMMEGQKVTLYFSPEKLRTDFSIMGGMAKMTMISDVKDTNSIILMKMMGQKMKMTVGEKMAEQMKGRGEASKLPKDIKIEHHRSDTKKILDFDTHMVGLSYRDKDGNPVLMKYYVTEQIKTPVSISRQLPDDVDLGGVPLEYEIVIPGKMRMKYKAISFDKLGDKTVFEVPEGYEEIDPAMLGGFGDK